MSPENPTILPESALLRVADMGQADALTIAGGIPGIDLMEKAGLCCAEVIESEVPKSETLVLCGPGNNGGDGFVVARLLEAAGWSVSVSLLGSPAKLAGDAQLAYEAWIGAAKSPVLFPFDVASLDGIELVVDSVFGAGLSRDVEGVLAGIIEEVTRSKVPVVAVDMPSGVDGDTGQVRGSAFSAAFSVTFFRKKPGHLLMPGRMLCGKTIVGDIGIQRLVLETIGPKAGENKPSQWSAAFSWPSVDGHKYSRGHSVVVSGAAAKTGAARLAARSALRVGSGLVSVVSPSSAVLVNASHLTAVMVKSFSDFETFQDVVQDERLSSFVIGPGNGVGQRTREKVLHLLSLGRSVVLDADALTSFEDDREPLLSALHGGAVLTPHGGEFKRLFPDITETNKLDAAREAAQLCGAVVVLKGPDSVIAHPDGRALINSNAPPWLGTAGSGDVLAGLVCGLMAQGMPSFEAAAAGVWIHGAAAQHFGIGLIAEDLPEMVPDILADLMGRARP